MWTTVLLAILLGTPSAEAASCSSAIRSAKASRGNALGPAYSRLAACDRGEAEATFDSLLPNARTVDALINLCMAAIAADTWTPVWKVLSHEALDWDVRDQVSQRIGASCAQNPKVVSFLKGAYFGLRDLEFQQWDDALIECQDEDLAVWIRKQASTPPSAMFDDKYNALMSVLVQREKAGALPYLAKAAIAGSARGPFDAILIQMDAAVQPGIGDSISPADQTALENALVEVAQSVPPDKARAVGDRLANAGSNEAAARLLPKVYPAQQKSGGMFEYGAVSIERADCDGEKKAVLHVATIQEPGTRWIILGDVRAPMQALKPRLGKCTSEGEWAVTTTSEPVSNSREIDHWVDGLEKQWTDKGYAVSTRSERTIKLD